MTTKLKVGDRVQMKDSYGDWLTDYAHEFFTVDGKYDGRHDSDLMPLFASRLYAHCPLIGTVKAVDSYRNQPSRRLKYTAHVCFENYWGQYTCWVTAKDVKKLRKIKK